MMKTTETNKKQERWTMQGILQTTSAATGIHTFIAARNDIKHMMMASFLQSVQKATVNTVRLVHDNVQQLFSCLDRFLVFRLNRLQLFLCKSFRLKHVASNALCVDHRWHFVIDRTQHIGVICNYTTWPMRNSLMLRIISVSFKVIQGHQFWYQSKAHMWLFISD